MNTKTKFYFLRLGYYKLSEEVTSVVQCFPMEAPII